MKTIAKYLLTIISASTLLSCSEADNDFSVPATIKVVNLIKGENKVIVKTGPNPIDYATVTEGAKVGYETSKNFYFSSNNDTEVVIVPESNTLNTLYSEMLNFKGIHSLYLFGTSDEVEVLLLEDNIKQFTDSIMGIRFVNLVKELSGPINISDQTGTTIISGLEFKSATDYLEFSTKKVDGSYTFKFADSAGNILTTSLFINPLKVNDVLVKKNITIAITEITSTTPIGTFNRYKFNRFNNY